MKTPPHARAIKAGHLAPFVWCGVPTAGLDDADVAELDELLDDEERARIARLRPPQARRDATIAHGLRRIVLGEVTAQPPQGFRFRPSCAGGKPKPCGIRGIDVSLTHCNGYAAAAAVANGGRIGIDAEPVARAIEPALIDAIAAPTERGVSGYPAALWTLKEALAKAEGSGLALDLSRIETDPRALRLVSAPPSFGDPITWRLERHWVGAFAVAIAFGPPAGQ